MLFFVHYFVCIETFLPFAQQLFIFQDVSAEDIPEVLLDTDGHVLPPNTPNPAASIRVIAGIIYCFLCFFVNS